MGLDEELLEDESGRSFGLQVNEAPEHLSPNESVDVVPDGDQEVIKQNYESIPPPTDTPRENYNVVIYIYIYIIYIERSTGKEWCRGSRYGEETSK